MSKIHLNPPTLFPSQKYGFSQAVATRGGTTVHISGQVGWDTLERIVDAQNLEAQTTRALENIEAAVKAAGGTRDDVVSLRLYIVGERAKDSTGLGAALRRFFHPDRLPASSWIGVASLSAGEEALIEIEAVAVIEDSPPARPAD